MNMDAARARRFGRQVFAIALAGAVVLAPPAFGRAAAPAAPAAAAPQAGSGILREGFWVLNQKRSKKLKPGTQTLWIVKDDGDRITWVSVQKDLAGKVTISSWDGRYDGKPVEVKGTGMMTYLVATGPATFNNWGEIPGVGSYREKCTVSAGGKRLYCEGEVTGKDGVQHWIDDFDWHSANLN